ncbi:Cytochrome b5 [Tetrabaena socialis]|uniref:Cytochrome b5 n=1 Tax=Tetrabaena socialis TaxID=47790 RepID=A0A2J7ZU14_9CHLO|nr:Cytochrome b5 [Tetrabaena socialis]|eukprot:PNH03752.1 Cytochrome b5 [Tetrabaena socialis]
MAGQACSRVPTVLGRWLTCAAPVALSSGRPPWSCRYDITDYVEDHPGGESILRNIGGDATEGFHGPQHPVTTFLLVEEYCVGKLAEGEEGKLGR